MGPPWRINPTTHRTMRGTLLPRSYISLHLHQAVTEWWGQELQGWCFSMAILCHLIQVTAQEDLWYITKKNLFISWWIAGSWVRKSFLSCLLDGGKFLNDWIWQTTLVISDWLFNDALHTFFLVNTLVLEIFFMTKEPVANQTNRFQINCS